jgi:hypothetical protein
VVPAKESMRAMTGRLGPFFARVVLLSLVGCALHLQGTYDPSYFEDTPPDPSDLLPGKILVETDPADDTRVATIRVLFQSLTMPVGPIMKEAARRTFGGKFKGGAVMANDRADAASVRGIVSLRFVDYEPSVTQSDRPNSPLRFAATIPPIRNPSTGVINDHAAAASVKVSVQYSEPTGQVVWQRTYSGWAAAGADQREARDYSIAAHWAMEAALQHAANDVEQALEPGYGDGFVGWLATVKERRFDPADFTDWMPYTQGATRIHAVLDTLGPAWIPARVRLRSVGPEDELQLAVSPVPPNLRGLRYAVAITHKEAEYQQVKTKMLADGYVLVDQDSRGLQSTLKHAGIWVLPPTGSGSAAAK